MTATEEFDDDDPFSSDALINDQHAHPTDALLEWAGTRSLSSADPTLTGGSTGGS